MVCNSGLESSFAIKRSSAILKIIEFDRFDSRALRTLRLQESRSRLASASVPLDTSC